jgi:hypothetical protein
MPRPYPLPLVHQPSEAEGRERLEKLRTPLPAPERGREPAPEATPPEDDYQWMLLL